MPTSRTKTMNILACCFLPHNSLRRQLWMSFGLTAFVSISIVFALAITVSIQTGNTLKTNVLEQLRTIVDEQIFLASRCRADTISKKLDNLGGLVGILAEATSDRIVGYPEPGWENDTYIPFLDTMSGLNKYPIRSARLPMDWEIDINVNHTNFYEHVQERYYWYTNFNISTAHATYRFQGNCNPNATIGAQDYIEGCTDANNDHTTGGVVFPTLTNDGLSQKAAELSIFLKPLYEAHKDVHTLGIFFVNEGAGSNIYFPSHILNGSSSYTSAGCEEQLSQKNTLTNRSFLTKEKRNRCRPQNTTVMGREYNPLERSWCHDQIKAGGATTIAGPYLDAFVHDLWLLTIGQAVFDRKTGELLACTLADVSISDIQEALIGNETIQADMNIALVRWDDGTVIASSEWDTKSATTTMNVGELSFLSTEEFQARKNLVNFSQVWNADEVRHKFEDHLIRRIGGEVVAVYPAPVPPQTYDVNYRPECMIIISIGKDVFTVYDTMINKIDNDMRVLIGITTTVAILGMGFALGIIWLVARTLTQPLEWIDRTSKRIINSNEGASNEQDENLTSYFKFTPRTEITSVVAEFNSMIKSFSGEGPAKVAHSPPHEIRNLVTWQKEFEILYFLELPDCDSDKWKSITKAGKTNRKSTTGESSIDSTDFPIDPSIPTDILTAGDSALPMASKAIAQVRRSFRASFIPFTEDDLLTMNDTEDTSSTNEKGDVMAKAITESINAETALTSSQACPCRLNKGRNILASDYTDRDDQIALQQTMNKVSSVRKSPLFWWIVFLIVVPILLTMTIIAVLVEFTIKSSFLKLYGATQKLSLRLLQENVAIAAFSRASFAEEVLSEPVRDLHLHSRYATWLLFRGIEQSDTLTDVEQSTEECKDYPADRSCPFFNNDTRTPCDCDWHDSHNFSCEVYETSTRPLQRRFYAGQAHDIDSMTGTRQNTTYPHLDRFPNETLWWNNFTFMPGFSQGKSEVDHITTFGRVRLFSALAVVEFPIFNHKALLERSKHLGIYVGLEADGMLLGYNGCDYAYSQFSHFRSTKENKAFEIGKQLCPIGKYGYDVRCRGWYASGKANMQVHVTPPYTFAGTNRVASTMTSPLVGPNSTVYVGQSLLDFDPQAIFDSLIPAANDQASNSGDAILITPHQDYLDGDTVVAPKYNSSSTGDPIQEFILPYDNSKSEYFYNFTNWTLKVMKNGEKGNATFLRHNEEGGREEMFIAFSPVYVRSLSPKDPSDFARGIEVKSILVYSLGFLASADGLTERSKKIELLGAHALRKSTSIFFTLIAVVAFVVLGITSMIAVAVTRPMMNLLVIIKYINEKGLQEDIPPMSGGSREVNQVLNSFAKLYKVVRFSNTAFFSGNMIRANKFLNNALRLFRNVDDKKAIAIASNNLGATLLSIYSTKAKPNKCYVLNGKCIRCSIQECFDEAIRLGTDEYIRSIEDFAGDEVRIMFAQQLANRLFNRGIFMLVTRNDPCSTHDAVEQGISDLIQTRDLDSDVRNYWIATRQVKRNSAVYYKRLLRRCAGLTIPAVRCEYLNDDWDIRDLLHEADSLLFAIGQDDNAPMLREMNRTARLQQLEEHAIRKQFIDGEGPDSVNIAIRMLVEDEFLLESCFVAASRALTASFSAEGRPISWTDSSVAAVNDCLRAMSRKCKTKIDVGKNVIFVDSSSIDNAINTRMNFTMLYEDICNTNDFVGFVVCEINDEVSFPLSRKEEMQEQHRTSLAHLPSTTFGRTDLLATLRRVVGIMHNTPPLARKNETWVVLVIDMKAWSVLDTINMIANDASQEVAGYLTNIVIVGVDLKSIMEVSCQKLCSAKNSLYISTSCASFNAAFAEVSDHIQKSQTLGGITMEIF